MSHDDAHSEPHAVDDDHGNVHDHDHDHDHDHGNVEGSASSSSSSSSSSTSSSSSASGVTPVGSMAAGLMPAGSMPAAAAAPRSHGHSHGHVHGGGARAGARHAGRLRISFVLIVAFLVVQVIVGLTTNSLALLSDAGHMATDALGMGMALAAISAASRHSEADHRTFGLYRLEILAALANAVLLFAVAGYVLFEAALRLSDGPHIATTPVLLIGILGLAVNVVSFLLLREGAKESLNVRGAYLEVLSDMLGSVGVIVAAIVMRITNWGWVDPLVGAGIGLFILPRAWRLGRDALRVLVQAAPAGIEIGDVRDALLAQPGVAGVHDLHVWTLTSEMDVLTAHLVVAGGHTTQSVLDEARTLLQDRFGLAHATLQVENNVDHACDDVDW